jgi:magnesium-transporting ATPase (P-type)
VGAKLGVLSDVVDAAAPRVREWPFDSTRKRMSVVRRIDDTRVRVDVKGALEAVLPRCARIVTRRCACARRLRPSPDRRAGAPGWPARRCVLAAAYREGEADAVAGASDENESSGT